MKAHPFSSILTILKIFYGPCIHFQLPIYGSNQNIDEGEEKKTDFHLDLILQYEEKKE